MHLRSADALIQFDPATGAAWRIDLDDTATPLLESTTGLFDLAMPLADELPHRLRITADQNRPEVTLSGESLTLHWDSLISPRGDFDVGATLHLAPHDGGGFVARLVILNHSTLVIPQVLFPNLSGLRPTGPAVDERLYLGRATKHPYRWMKVPDGAAAFYDLYRREYYTYGMREWCMKWFHLGNGHRGVSVFSKALAAEVQGLYVEKDKHAEQLTIAWSHYPHIPPGARWISPDIVIHPHQGSWRVGAAQYKQFVALRLPPAPPSAYLQRSLGARSVFFSTYLYDNTSTFRFRDLPVIARDALDHGLREIIAWFLFEAYFELPMRLNPKLGTASELRQAVTECRRLGVNVAAFVSCRSLKTSAASLDWFETDEHGNRRTQAWTYSLNFVPPFNPLYCNRDESAFACPGAAGYRQAFLASCRALNELGFSSICFDQIFTDRLCYAAEHGHRPQEILEPLHRMLVAAHQRGQSIDSQATISGEFFSDVSQTFQHYNWDWITGTESLDDLEPFRFVFPRFRLGLLVDRSRRWLLEGFARGLMLNFLPDGGEGLIGEDEPSSRLIRVLVPLREQFARFFETGEFDASSVDGKSVAGGLFHCGDESLLVVANPTAGTIRATARIEPSQLAMRFTEALGPYETHLIHYRHGVAVAQVRLPKT